MRNLNGRIGGVPGLEHSALVRAAVATSLESGGRWERSLYTAMFLKVGKDDVDWGEQHLAGAMRMNLAHKLVPILSNHPSSGISCNMRVFYILTF